MVKIGVFDSGIGGLSVVRAIQKALPNQEVVFKNDAQHVPYGTRELEEIYRFTKPILKHLIDDGCEVIVIACNTVTTNLIDRLRRELTIPLVGMEPMVKPAATATKSGVIAICATPRTLSSPRYRWLKNQFAKNVKVLEPDCNDWSQMVENNQVDHHKITQTMEQVCNEGADQIVLGCTHYHWIEALIKNSVLGRAEVLQPEQPVIKQLKQVLSRQPETAHPYPYNP